MKNAWNIELYTFIAMRILFKGTKSTSLYIHRERERET